MRVRALMVEKCNNACKDTFKDGMKQRYKQLVKIDYKCSARTHIIIKQKMTAIAESSLSIQLKRVDRIYYENDKVEGSIIVNVFRGWTHQGIHMMVTGFIYLNPIMSRSNGINNANTSNSNINSNADNNGNLVVKPVQLVNIEREIQSSGKFPEGIKEIPFQFILMPTSNQSLIDTYHGVSISVLYTITITCDRGVMKKKLKTDYEFIVQVPMKLYDAVTDNKPRSFCITLESLKNVDPEFLKTLPNFKIVGTIYKTICPITQPLTGMLLCMYCMYV